MKKGLIFLLCAILLALLAAGGVGLLTWQSVTESSVPLPKAVAAGQEIVPSAYEWHTPVFGGLLYKDFFAAAGNASDLGEVVADEGLVFQGPPGYENVFRCWKDDTLLTETALPEARSWGFSDPGSYRAEITSTLLQQEGEGYGVFTFSVTFTVVPATVPEEDPMPTEPTMVSGETTLRQGDVLSIRLYAIEAGVIPTATTDLGLAVFTPCGEEGGWYCAVPISNTRAAGSYSVQVSAGEGHTWDIPVTVEKFDFVEQDLTIDVTDPVISEANSPAAYQQYREKIPPLFQTYDEERYWQGIFIQPAEGRISTQFGTIRYTNGDYDNPSVHWGMDIANAEGTPVQAPAAGRVVLAENLLNTGNTVVIEHGGGLKSYYFHMSQLNVSEEDMVEQGQQIGAIGTTGYSTGPHLHFEVRIGNQAISPQILFEGTAGLYAAEDPSLTSP